MNTPSRPCRRAGKVLPLQSCWLLIQIVGCYAVDCALCSVRNVRLLRIALHVGDDCDGVPKDTNFRFAVFHRFVLLSHGVLTTLLAEVMEI